MDRLIMCAMVVIFTLTIGVAIGKRVQETQARVNSAMTCALEQHGKLNKEGICVSQ